VGRSGRTSSGSELALEGGGGTRGLGLMGRGLLGFEVWARLWLVLVLCRLCVACLSGVAWL
jgi:hypothetical protein